jgi:PAS domain S-box-containing protein
MTKKTGSLQDSAALRQRAEGQLKERSLRVDRSPASAEDALRLVHELQVHQVELELQNEMLVELRRQLERSLERYTNLYDFAPVGYFTLASDGIIEQANLAGAAFFGMERSLLKGKRMGNFLTIESRSAFNAFLGNILVGQDKEQCDLCIALYDSPPRHLHAEGISLRGDDGRECQVAQVVLVDITARRNADDALRKSEALFRLTFDQSPLGASLLSLAHQFLRANDALCQLTGYAPGELSGMHLSQVIHPDDLAADLEQSQRLVAGEFDRVDLELRYLCKDRTVVWVHRSMRLMRDALGHPMYFLPTMEDITERKRAAEVEQTLREAAEAASRAKSDFLAAMSHELRTPMNAIIGLTHLTLKTQLSPKQLDYQQKILNAGQTLLFLINDILDLAKIEAGKIDLELVPFRVDQVFQTVTSILGEKAKEKGLDLTVRIADDVPLSAVGDPSRLTQVLVNLAGNAVKFTNNGVVALTADVQDGQGSHPLYRFSVQDTGIGIPAEKQAKLFQAFSQVVGPKQNAQEGTGLGLAISKQLVTLLGGTIGLSSGAGVGSTFFFTIPLVRAEESADCDTPTEPTESQQFSATALYGVRVLLVEDNMINQQVAKELLKAAGATVSIASNGCEALERLREDASFDAILMDLEMPVMGGYKSVEQIRSVLGLQSLPIIALTAHAFASEKKRCLNAGMNDYLSKPVEPDRLVATLLRWVKPKPYVGEPAAVAVLSPDDRTMDLAGLLPGIDFPCVLRRLSGDAALLRELLVMFRKTWGQVSRALLEAMSEGRLVEVQRTVHTLRGAAATLSMLRVVAAARDLETALQQGGGHGIGHVAKFEALDDALRDVFGGIAALPECAVSTQ